MAPSRPASVLLVAPQAPPAVGGVERHVAELARGLADRGVAVTLAVCDPSGSLAAVESASERVSVRRFPTLGGDGTYLLSPRLAAWAWANAGGFDVVHGHSYHTPVALSAFVAARRRGRPFVLTTHYHGTGHSPLRRALHVPYRPLGSAMVRGAAVVIAVSRAEEALLRADFGRGLRTSVVPNGVDVDDILAAERFPATDERRLVLVAGRLERYKHVDRVIEAMTELRATHRLVVVGDGPEREQLAARAAALGLASDVAFLGSVSRDELHRWLRTADVVVSLSAHEAFGIVAVEAAVAGATVVASAIPAHLELSEIAPPGRLTFVAEDATPAQVAASIAAGSRAHLDRADLAGVPTWSDVTDRTMELYAEVLDRLPSGRRRLAPAGPVDTRPVH